MFEFCEKKILVIIFFKKRGKVSHTKGITAWILPARVLHLQEKGDYLGCRPTCIIRHMSFHPTGCIAEGN